jgi:dTDP-4-amino-4,6-dideoxygalactose transaminase
MRVPILDLKAQYQSIRTEVERKVLEILDAQAFILGPEVEALEKELAAYSGARHAVGVSSGTDGLIISLMALGIGPGDVVVTSPFSFFATAGAISRVGARPVFCDIDEATYNLDPGRLEKVLKEAGRHGRVKAIMPVHLYGQCADMDPIGELAERHGAIVIEDAAQSVGSEYPSRAGARRAGAMGLLGTLSFYPSKNLSAAGDAGMVLTNDASLAEKLVALRVHGGRERYFHDVVGGNFRLDALQAAVLRVKLGRLDGWQAKRRERAEFYNKRFISEALVEEGFVGIPAAAYKSSGAVNYHTYHQYVIRAEQRDELQAFLKEKEVGSSIFYPLGLHLQKCFADLGYRAGAFPVTEKVSQEVLALPMYPELTPEQQDHVVFSILEFYRR